jgi:hypothetical protein
MKQKTRMLIVATALAVLLQGCSSTRNSFYGPIKPIGGGYIGGQTSCEGFTASAANLEEHFRGNACASLASPDDKLLAKRMYESGFALVHARCNDFFNQKAGTQLGINTAFDSIAPVVALLTGILSIVNFKNDARRADYESALAFGSVAVVSGLKVYESNFLFAAENVESVRELTVSAINTHANGVRALDNPTFYTSAQYVIQNQTICTPGHIRDLVKRAITDKRFTAVARDTQEILGVPAAPAVAGTPPKAEAGATIQVQ